MRPGSKQLKLIESFIYLMNLQHEVKLYEIVNVTSWRIIRLR
jgi:hypothetical protein